MKVPRALRLLAVRGEVPGLQLPGRKPALILPIGHSEFAIAVALTALDPVEHLKGPELDRTQELLAAFLSL